MTELDTIQNSIFFPSLSFPLQWKYIISLHACLESCEEEIRRAPVNKCIGAFLQRGGDRRAYVGHIELIWLISYVL